MIFIGLRIACFVARYGSFTGSQKVLRNVLRDLSEHINPIVFFPAEGVAAEEFRSSDIRVRIVQAPTPLTRFGGYLPNMGLLQQGWIGLRHFVPYWSRLAKELRSVNPDVLHCNGVRSAVLSAPPGKLAGYPTILHLHGMTPRMKRFPVSSLIGTSVDRIVGVADALEDEVENLGTYTTIHNGVPLDPDLELSTVKSVQEDVLKERGLSKDEVFRLVTTSSLVPYKGLHHLMDAIGRISQEGTCSRKIVWFILGDSSHPTSERYKKSLQKLAESHEIQERIFWMGWQDDPVAWKREAEVVVLPTIKKEAFEYEDGSKETVQCSEGLPLTILEGLAVGTPAIGSRVAGVPEILEDGQNGIIVPPGDSIALAGAIKKLESNHTLLHQMSQEAKKTSQAFSEKKTSEKFLRLYENLSEPKNSVLG